MFQVGDKVFVNASAQIDVGFLAWDYVKAHPLAMIKQRMDFARNEDVPESEMVYAVEWPEDLQGGHTCQGTVEGKRGQFVAAKHLDLCFEASREVVTVPQIDPRKE